MNNNVNKDSVAISKVIVIFIYVIIAISCGTTNSLSSNKARTSKLQDTMVRDRDGNRYPVKVLSDGKLWMAANLNLNISDSYCYGNIKENCEHYGRLYTWASARQGCKLAGEGWRLPTKDEWQQLVALYGGIAVDSTAIRKEAYEALIYGGTSGFNALLGGGRTSDGQYARVDAHGFFWTATEIDSSAVWFYNFAKGSQALYQQDGGEKTEAFSVRCVKSIDSLK